MLTLLSILALVVAGLALGYVYRLQQELEQATRRLDRYNRALFDANDELQKMQEELQQIAAALRVEQMQRSGGVRFTPDTTVREAEFIHPQAMQILAGFHVGDCADCAAEPGDTLAQVCRDKGVDMSALLANLNTLLQTDSGGAAPQPVKLPNVSLELT